MASNKPSSADNELAKIYNSSLDVSIASDKPYKVFSHLLLGFDEQTNKTHFNCFCKKPNKPNEFLRCIDSKYYLKCSKNKCGFRVGVTAAEQLLANKMLKSVRINLPICNNCKGCVLDIGRVPKWKTYMEPRYSCLCPNKEHSISVYPRKDELLNSAFDFDVINNIQENKEDSGMTGSNLPTEFPDLEEAHL